MYTNTNNNFFSGLFEGLEECFTNEHIGYINLPEHNWVVSMDLMLQMFILSTGTRNLYVPTYVQNVCINASEHLKVTNNGRVPVLLNQTAKTCK